MQLPAPDTVVTDHARLWWPPGALVGCVRGAMLRDTRGQGQSGEALLTCFPASPLMGLTWWLHGQLHAVERPGFVSHARPIPTDRLTLSGPYTGPSVFRAEGEVQVLQLLFLPDALHTLIGVDPAELVNQVVPARPWLPEAWQAWADDVAAAPDDEQRLALIAGFLASRWQAAHATAAPQLRYREWAEHLALRAAGSAAGRSLRQAERRIKSWAGQSLRDLRIVARGEAAFFAGARSQPGTLRLADIAADTGYADQAHLSRDTRRMTGFAPAELERLVRSHPAFWAYRLWV